MIDAKKLPTLLAYSDGLLSWKRRPESMFSGSNAARICKSWNARFAGAPAFTSTDANGYKVGALMGKSVRAHTIVWALHAEQWPEGEIDHINGDPSDNRIQNLRDVSHAVNCRNQKARSTNKTGFPGVFWSTNDRKYIAKIKVAGVSHTLGYFDAASVAAEEYAKAARRFGFHANHGRTPDRAAIKRQLEAGEHVPGADLVRGDHIVTVRVK